MHTNVNVEWLLFKDSEKVKITEQSGTQTQFHVHYKWLNYIWNWNLPPDICKLNGIVKNKCHKRPEERWRTIPGRDFPGPGENRCLPLCSWRPYPSHKPLSSRFLLKVCRKYNTVSMTDNSMWPEVKWPKMKRLTKKNWVRETVEGGAEKSHVAAHRFSKHK